MDKTVCIPLAELSNLHSLEEMKLNLPRLTFGIDGGPCAVVFGMTVVKTNVVGIIVTETAAKVGVGPSVVCTAAETLAGTASTVTGIGAVAGTAVDDVDGPAGEA